MSGCWGRPAFFELAFNLSANEFVSDAMRAHRTGIARRHEDGTLVETVTSGTGIFDYGL